MGISFKLMLTAWFIISLPNALDMVASPDRPTTIVRAVVCLSLTDLALMPVFYLLVSIIGWGASSLQKSPVPTVCAVAIGAVSTAVVFGIHMTFEFCVAFPVLVTDPTFTLPDDGFNNDPTAR